MIRYYLMKLWAAIKNWFAAKDALIDGHLILPEEAPAAYVSRILVGEFMRERRRDRNWKRLWRTLMATSVVVSLAYGALFYLHATGWKPDPRERVIGVVRVEGAIMSSSLASAEKILPALQRAFESPHVSAVVLSIDSGGGLPLEAERIGYQIAELRKRHPKPVHAVINSVGASAALMIALNADSIIAGRYSMVGSIGAVMSTWDLHEAAEALKVRQRAFASGTLKIMLNPFLPATPEATKKAQDLVNVVGERFYEDLRERRKGKLRDDIAYDTGEVWYGQRALEIGLIDELCTLECLATRYNAKIHDFGPSANGGLFGASTSFSAWLDARIASALASLLYQSPPAVQ